MSDYAETEIDSIKRKIEKTHNPVEKRELKKQIEFLQQYIMPVELLEVLREDQVSKETKEAEEVESELTSFIEKSHDIDVQSALLCS